MKVSSFVWKGVPAMLFLLLWGCNKDYDSATIIDCPKTPDTNFSLQQLHEQAGESATEIQVTLQIVAVVISNDKHGNMFNELYLQSTSSDADFGLHIELELRESYLRFPTGTEVVVQLKGLWMQKKHGLLTLGKPLMLFGATSIGRIPYHEIDTHLIPTCGLQEVQPKTLGFDELQLAEPNTLVQLSGVEFLHVEMGTQLAEEAKETIRNLTDCNGNEMRLITSGYADFYDRLIPDAHGSITGILLADSKGPYLKIRNWDDIQFDSARCRIPIEPVTTNALFISEIADPDNAPEARFIELYNSSDQEIPLEGWQLIRYTNANTEPGSSTDLSGYSIGAKNAFTIAADSAGFKSVFSISPDLEAGKNSGADSNGDDNLLLMDPFGSIIDIYGRIGEDGSGTDHEFEDGRALRNSEIIKANSEFLPSEWLIFNDTGEAGTIREPQQAPQDFSPGLKD